MAASAAPAATAAATEMRILPESTRVLYPEVAVPYRAPAVGGPTGARGASGGYRKRVLAGMDILRIIAAIILPPLGVFLQVGLKGQFWLNVVLTILGFIPGVIHALYVILSVK